MLIDRTAPGTFCRGLFFCLVLSLGACGGDFKEPPPVEAPEHLRDGAPPEPGFTTNDPALEPSGESTTTTTNVAAPTAPGAAAPPHATMSTPAARRMDSVPIERVRTILEGLDTAAWHGALCAHAPFPLKDGPSMECGTVLDEMTNALSLVKGVDAGQVDRTAFGVQYPGHYLCSLMANFTACVDAAGLTSLNGQAMERLGAYLEKTNSLELLVLHQCDALGTLRFPLAGISVSPSPSEVPTSYSLDIGLCGPSLNRSSEGVNRIQIEALAKSELASWSIGLGVDPTKPLYRFGIPVLDLPPDLPCRVEWKLIERGNSLSLPEEKMIRAKEAGPDASDLDPCVPWIAGWLTLRPLEEPAPEEGEPQPAVDAAAPPAEKPTNTP